MHLAPGGYVIHMTSPSTSAVPISADAGGITYPPTGYIPYDPATDSYRKGDTVVVLGPAPGREYASTNPNTGGTWASA